MEKTSYCSQPEKRLMCVDKTWQHLSQNSPLSSLKNTMSLDYAETSEMNSKNASIQRRLQHSDSDGENDNCPNVESGVEDGSD